MLYIVHIHYYVLMYIVHYYVLYVFSVYLTPKQCVGQQCGEWIEIAYGTNTGMVRVIFQHPETVGQGMFLCKTVNRLWQLRIQSQSRKLGNCARIQC